MTPFLQVSRGHPVPLPTIGRRWRPAAKMAAGPRGGQAEWPGGEKMQNKSRGSTWVPGGWLCRSGGSRVGEQTAAEGRGRAAVPSHVSSLTRPRASEMRLLGWGLGQRCSVVGPAKREAETVAWAWL